MAKLCLKGRGKMWGLLKLKYKSNHTRSNQFFAEGYAMPKHTGQISKILIFLVDVASQTKSCPNSSLELTQVHNDLPYSDKNEMSRGKNDQR